jgi:hypothetical protein
VRVSGKRAAALAQSTSHQITELKARWLGASTVDGVGGQHGTGVRGWFIYTVHGRGLTPLPCKVSMRDFEVASFWEDVLEDFAIWYVTFQPHGNAVSGETMGKYVSQVRAWYQRRTRTRLGLGAEGSRVADILKGYRRLVDQPPPLEREGCMPDDLRRGLDAVYPSDGSDTSAAWRAALTYGFATLSRGGDGEFALDDSRKEEFESSQHLTPADVTLAISGGYTNLSVLMRKRKDLRVLRGKQSRVVLAGGGTVLDPVGDMIEWLRRRRSLGLAEDGPLFCWTDGRSFTVNEVRSAVRACMQAAGRDPARFGAHSLRIGAATAALAAGVSPQLIRLMGRWSSDVYELYCRMSLQAAVGVGRVITSVGGVQPLESESFHQEHLELLSSELATFKRASSGAAGMDAVEEER